MHTTGNPDAPPTVVCIFQTLPPHLKCQLPSQLQGIHPPEPPSALNPSDEQRDTHNDTALNAAQTDIMPTSYMAPAPANGDPAQHFSDMFDACHSAYYKGEVLKLVDNFLGMHDLWVTQFNTGHSLRLDDSTKTLRQEQLDMITSVADWVDETLTASTAEGVLSTIPDANDRYTAQCNIYRAWEAKQAY